MSASKNIASHLPEMAAKLPDALAVAVQQRRGYAELTFRELDRECDGVARGLERAGISRGMRTVLMVTPSLDFFALTFALFKVGAVPVLVDPGMGLDSLKKCLDEARPQAFVGTPKAHVARLLFGWAKSTLKALITVGPRLGWGGTTLAKLRDRADEPYVMSAPEPGETAAILFTSGSTGVPKGAVYTHEVFNAQVEILRRDYGIEPGERDLATFPLFALFGPALGMAAVVPDMDASKPATADPARLLKAVVDYGATNMFVSPALIGVLERHGQRCREAGDPFTMRTLRRVISAGAPADPDSLARFTPLLEEGVEVLNSYGATEALPVSFIGTRELLGETSEATREGAGICVGRPVQSIELRIATITDSPIASWSPGLEVETGEIGEILVKGPVASASYFERPTATELAKIADPEGGGFWHRMGDLGWLDEKGRLWMCGRLKHRVQTASGTLFTIPCERVFNSHTEVRRTALVGVESGGELRPVLCVELEAGVRKGEQERIRGELLEIGAGNPLTSTITTVLFHPSFPVDVRHNAKIFREKLATWAADPVRGNA